MNKVLIIFALYILGISGLYIINSDDQSTIQKTKSERDFNIESYVKGLGYPFEAHSVTTIDGYILQLHRISSGKSNSADKEKPAVLLMHDLLSSSAGWLLTGAEKSLAFQLADNGYDVWLGNNRGNTFSRNHSTLDADKNVTFWDFSFHEMGIYDDPAFIDYILGVTKYEKISFVGYGEGSTQFFVMASVNTTYNDKITVMAALSPVAYMSHMAGPITSLLKDHYNLLEVFQNYFNIAEFLPHASLITEAVKYICSDAQVGEICDLVFSILGGFDTEEMDKTIIADMFNDDLPAGTSFKAVKHLFQEFQSGYFRWYDYGRIENIDRYGALAPPEYSLTNVEAPVGLFYAQNDFMSAVEDVLKLKTQLKNATEYQINYEFFNHFDFLIAKDVNSLVNYDVINHLNTYNGLALITSTSTTPTSTTTTTTTETTPTSSSPTGPSTDTGPTTDSSKTTGPSTTPSSSPYLSASIWLSFMGCVYTILLK